MLESPESAEPTRPRKRNRWASVERARERLDRQADQIMRAMIKKAKAGDTKAAAWLLAHTVVADGTGNELRPVATGVDKPAEQSSSAGDSAPRILIFNALGADFARLAGSSPDRPALPVLDVSPAVPSSK